MTKPVCAYCKLPNALTREHLWPASLHSRLSAANKQTSNSFWLARLQREIPSEPKIRDVCAHCNNVVLSELDAYICQLFDSTLVHIPNRHERVTFEHDYHLLKRWLLKLCFNSARVHNSRDLYALDVMLPYIMGESSTLGKSVQLFLQLSYPEEVPEEELSANAPADCPVFFKPTMNRVGHIFFRVHGVGEKLLRAVHLRSFTFYLAFFKPSESCVVLNDFADHFSHYTGALLLRPSNPIVETQCNGAGAWTLFKGSRSNQLIFDDDI
ncbi:MAG TPA: hypothetical protein DFK12_02325 [Gallionellaceae bacterium]|nr:hypothetical protein [Gallionellaceae bacterium]